MVKPVLVSSFIDEKFMADLTTGRSHTGIIRLMRNTPMYCYSKSQYCVETSTHGSEYTAALICTNQIFDLCNTLCYFGVPLQMVPFMPAVKLQR